MSRFAYLAALAAAALAAPAAIAPAAAGEIFGGLYIHDLKSPLTLSGVESGIDLHAGYRLAPMALWRLQPYGFVALNSDGNTHYGAIGVSRRFDLSSAIYVRPGIGLAIHSGSDGDFDIPGNGEIEFGSRILFEPELAIGTDIGERLSIEASLVHLSHGQLFGAENPGIDNLGVRLNVRL